MLNKKILIVDDEEKIRIMYSKYLSKQGYEVITAENGQEALNLFHNDKDISLVLLDVMMPIKDGYETCKEMKSHNNTPIIILTAKDGEDDELTGLECGADDYISKLASLKLILARIELILKRNTPEKEDIIECNGIEINQTTHIITVNGEPIEASLKEYDLLVYFIKNKNKALTRENLLKNVWNYDYYEDSRTLDTHIKKLRKKLGEKHDFIKTIWGVGYKFEV